MGRVNENAKIIRLRMRVRQVRLLWRANHAQVECECEYRCFARKCFCGRRRELTLFVCCLHWDSICLSVFFVVHSHSLIHWAICLKLALHLPAMKARTAHERALKCTQSILPMLTTKTGWTWRRVECRLVEGKGTPARTGLRRVKGRNGRRDETVPTGSAGPFLSIAAPDVVRSTVDINFGSWRWI